MKIFSLIPIDSHHFTEKLFVLVRLLFSFFVTIPRTNKLEVALCPRRNFIMSKSIPGEETNNLKTVN